MNVIKFDVALCSLCLLCLTPSCKVDKATPTEDIMEQEDVVANTIDTVSVNWNEETFHFEIQIGDDYFEEVSGIESSRIQQSRQQNQ